MPKGNPYLIKENLAKVEEVREIENEIPSYEEFIENYQEGNLNYSDLGYSDIGNSKSYGPTTYGTITEYVSFRGGPMIVRRAFYLEVECHNWAGGGGEKTIYSVSEALQHAHRLEDGWYSNVSSEVERKCATLIREAVRNRDIGNKVMAHIWVKGKFWGGYDWGTNYA